MVICWDGTSLRYVFVPVLGEIGAQRKRISKTRVNLVPNSPLGALSEVNMQDEEVEEAERVQFYPKFTLLTFPYLFPSTAHQYHQLLSLTKDAIG